MKKRLLFEPGAAASQHPWRLAGVLEMDGEYIVNSDPVIGYGHRAHEKMAETADLSAVSAQYGPGGLPPRPGLQSRLLHGGGETPGLEVPERAEFIRVITSELNRISSHLLWFGAYLMDLGAFTPFLYCFDDREHILDLLDRSTGSRLTYCFYRFGGVPVDVDDDFIAGCRAFVKRLRSRWADYDNLVTKNVIFIHRTRDVGIHHPGTVRQIRRHRPHSPGQRHCLRYPQERALFGLSPL